MESRTLDEMCDLIISCLIGAAFSFVLFSFMNNNYHVIKERINAIETVCKQVGSEPKEFDWAGESVCENGFTFEYEE